MNGRPRLVLAGAASCYGRAVLPLLTGPFEVVALAREPLPADPAAKWVACDLMSPERTAHALADAEIVVYLVAARKPMARMVQANRRDIEAILAANIADAVRGGGTVRQVVCGAETSPEVLAILRSGGAEVIPIASPADLLPALGLPGAIEHNALQPLPAALAARERLAEARRRALSQVVSIQRMELPPARDVLWVAEEYPRWLGRTLWPFLRTECAPDGSMRFISRLAGLTLLNLVVLDAQSTASRRIFAIRRGVLLRAGCATGIMDFRQIPGRSEVLIAISGYGPALPWWLYRWTQAIAHALVMWSFGRYLRGMCRRDPV